MYFTYDKEKSITVPFPFSRIMTPYMTTDTTEQPIDFSIHLTEWEPGAQVDEHSHDGAMEVMYCLSGSGVGSVGDEKFPLVPDTMIAAVSGEKHWIKNTGTTPLRVLCIFSPPISGESLRKRAQDAVAEYQKKQVK